MSSFYEIHTLVLCSWTSFSIIRLAAPTNLNSGFALSRSMNAAILLYSNLFEKKKGFVLFGVAGIGCLCWFVASQPSILLNPTQ